MSNAARRRGIANIWVAMVGFVVIAFVGMAIDMSYGFLSAHQLQNGADAAALAGARVVRLDPVEARQAAISIALANSVASDPLRLADNPGNAPSGDVVIGRYYRGTRRFEITLIRPNAVKAAGRRMETSLGGPISLAFGPILGVSELGLARSAIAMVGGGTGAGLITLNETEDRTFRLSGTITLDVRDVTTDPPTGGAIQINSDNQDALKTDGGPTLLADEINIKAEAPLSDPPEPPVFEGDVNPGEPQIPDPLAGLEPPPPGTWDPVPPGTIPTPVDSGTHYLVPGYYAQGIWMTGGQVILAPGVYILDGKGVQVTGGDFVANGVMLYIVDTTPLDSVKSCVKLTGNGVMTLNPADTGQYAGIAIWQDRDNTNEASIRGTDQCTVGGTLYFPKAHLDLEGTSDSFEIPQLICDTVRIHGTGTMNINYDGRFPSPVTGVFLVE